MKYAVKALGALAALAIASAAHAQNYPSREIKMIVPFPAGGPSDIVARIAADGMSKYLGHNIVIENVGGAGGTIGATRAAEAAPDGYTVFAASMGTIIAAPTFYPNLKYDSTKDFAPNGIRILMAVIQPPFQIFTTGRKIETLRDLEGLKLRTAGGAQELTANKLKIVSVKITAPETNEAMGRGTIDGGILAHVSIGAYGLTSMIKYATNGENFGSAALTWAISETKWKSLPPDVQKIMTETGERITMQACRKIDKGVDEQLTAWKASGISIVEFGQADRAALRKVFDEVGEDWAKRLDQRGKPGTETLKAFHDALAQSKAGQ